MSKLPAGTERCYITKVGVHRLRLAGLRAGNYQDGGGSRVEIMSWLSFW